MIDVRSNQTNKSLNAGTLKMTTNEKAKEKVLKTTIHFKKSKQKFQTKTQFD